MSGSCPLPQVEETLRPYIHTRQETLKIRQTLTRQLQSQFLDESELTHLSIVAPTASLEPSDASNLPDGLYNQYIQALTAHRKAQAQYDALKSEMQELQQASINAREKGDEKGGAGIGDHLTLLRQRQQHQKLEIISETLIQLDETEPNPTRTDLRELLREKLGDPPQPPIQGVGPVTEDGKISDLVFRLKKELLVAKSQVDRANAEKADAEERSKSAPKPSAGAQVAALRSARDELISWIEVELAKLPDEEQESSELDVSMNGGTHLEPLSEEAITASVQDRYDRYVEARKALIAQIEATSRHAHTALPSLETQTAAGASPKKPSTTVDIKAAEILPYLPSLIASSRDEASLLQQSAHLRRQLTTASEETSKTIQRLAGESYLVTPSATGMEAWAKAAEDAAGKTAAFVEEQVRVGEESVEHARGLLKMMRERREAGERLKGVF